MVVFLRDKAAFPTQLSRDLVLSMYGLVPSGYGPQQMATKKRSRSDVKNARGADRTNDDDDTEANRKRKRIKHAADSASRADDGGGGDAKDRTSEGTEDEDGDTKENETKARSLAEELVVGSNGMTVAVTGVPTPTTLIGIRNVTAGALVQFSTQSAHRAVVFGPIAKRVRLIQRFPDLWQT
jgi:hypothetical protein